MKKIYKRILILTSVIILLILFCFWQNNSIVISEFEHNDSEIPKSFDGFNIAHISDLHNKMFGKGQEYLVKKVKETSPDIIVITGDLIDRRRYNLDNAMEFIDQAVKIAPVYYVCGNHEVWSGKYSEIKENLLSKGVTVFG